MFLLLPVPELHHSFRFWLLAGMCTCVRTGQQPGAGMHDWSDWTPPNAPVLDNQAKAPAGIHFVHIPKTGGSTFGLALKRFLGAHFVQSVYDDESLQGCAALDPETKAPCATTVDDAAKISDCTMLIGCVLSHVPRMEYLDDARTISMTMLRRPASRVPSGYYHGYPHTGSKTRGCGKPPACLSFTEYIALERFQNVAVRMLAGNSRPYDEEKATVTQEHLSTAKAALDKFNAVGINEAFYSSIKVAFVEQGWAFDPDLLLAPAHKGDCAFGQKRHCHDLANPNSKRKVKNNKPDYKTFLNTSLAPQDVRDTLAHNNNFDQELWEHARGILCRKLAKHRDAVITGDARVIHELEASNICPDLP